MLTLYWCPHQVLKATGVPEWCAYGMYVMIGVCLFLRVHLIRSQEKREILWTLLKYTLWGNYGIKRILPKVGRNLRISGQGKTTLGKCQIADLATFLCKTWKLISASHRNSSSAGGSARVFKRRQCTAAKIYLNSPVCEFLLVLYFNCFE